MGRILLRILAVLLVLASVLFIYVYQEINFLESESVGDGVHVIYGAGALSGNAAVLRTEHGAVVVDTMTFRMQGDRIRRLAEKLGGGPTQVIINTHYHADHTHGNLAFPAGSRILASDATLAYLRAFDADYWRDGAESRLPNETFADDYEIRVGGKTIRCIRPGVGHTGGDVAVLFVEDRVLVTGDLFFHRRYPFIDIQAGGSAQSWDATLERLLALDFDRVIPGHGAVTDRAGLLGFQRFMRELWATAEAAARAGKTLEQTLADAEFREDSGYEVMSIPFVLRMDREFSLRHAFDEATGAVRPLPIQEFSENRGGSR